LTQKQGSFMVVSIATYHMAWTRLQWVTNRMKLASF
jgi:hypothetical protein